MSNYLCPPPIPQWPKDVLFCTLVGVIFDQFELKISQNDTCIMIHVFPGIIRGPKVPPNAHPNSQNTSEWPKDVPFRTLWEATWDQFEFKFCQNSTCIMIHVFPSIVRGPKVLQKAPSNSQNTSEWFKDAPFCTPLGGTWDQFEI